MAGSVNKVILVGNLGRDPEVRSMQDGRSMVNMSVATSDTWRDRQSGELHMGAARRAGLRYLAEDHEVLEAELPGHADVDAAGQAARH